MQDLTPRPAAPSPGGYLGGAGMALGIISCVITAVAIAGAVSMALVPPSPHQVEPGLGTVLSTEGVLWFFVVPALSFFCGVRYRRRAPSQSRLRQWPFLIGCLALTLWGVLLGLILGLA